MVAPEKESEAKTDSGLYLPAQAVEKPNRGLVVSWGEEVPEYLEHAMVLYGKYNGVEVKIEGEVYLILRTDEIYGFFLED